MPTLLLVDGSSYLYRAFHAMPDLRNSQGEPTGAIYGVLNMLRRLESDYKADVQGLRLRCQGQDLPRRLVSRIQGAPAVDAGRSGAQIEPIHAASPPAGWPMLMVDGVEADDVIGTLATKAAAQGHRRW
jgi:DNA polymerase-1